MYPSQQFQCLGSPAKTNRTFREIEGTRAGLLALDVQLGQQRSGLAVKLMIVQQSAQALLGLVDSPQRDHGSCCFQARLRIICTGGRGAVEKRERTIARRKQRNSFQCPPGFTAYCEMRISSDRCTCVDADTMRSFLDGYGASD